MTSDRPGWYCTVKYTPRSMLGMCCCGFLCASIARWTSSWVRLSPCQRCTRYSISSLHLDCAVVGSLQIRKTRFACENAIAFLTWLGWQLFIRRYWCVSVGFVYYSVEMVPSLVRVTKTSRKLTDLKECACVNCMAGLTVLMYARKSISLSSL